MFIHHYANDMPAGKINVYLVDFELFVYKTLILTGYVNYQFDRLFSF